jgi:hypothetical protein
VDDHLPRRDVQGRFDSAQIDTKLVRVHVGGAF